MPPGELRLGVVRGEGFAGIAVALVAASNPIGAILSAFFFSVLVAGAPHASAGGPQLYMIWALQGIIIIFMAMPHLSTLALKHGRRLATWRTNRR